MLDRLDAPITEADRWTLGSLTQRDLKQLIALLDKGRNGLSEALSARRSENQPRRSTKED